MGKDLDDPAAEWSDSLGHRPQVSAPVQIREGGQSTGDSDIQGFHAQPLHGMTSATHAVPWLQESQFLGSGVKPTNIHRVFQEWPGQRDEGWGESIHLHFGPLMV